MLFFFFVAQLLCLAYCHRWQSISGPRRILISSFFAKLKNMCVCVLAYCLLQVAAIMMIALKLRDSRKTASYLLPSDLWHSTYHSPAMSATSSRRKCACRPKGTTPPTLPQTHHMTSLASSTHSTSDRYNCRAPDLTSCTDAAPMCADAPPAATVDM